MIEFCCDSLILNNYLVQELQKNDVYFDTYCGDECYYYNEEGEEITREEYEENGGSEEYIDIYQYYIISSLDAERLAEFTNELVIYNEDLDLYILCVTHFGTAWFGVPANWKEPNEEEQKND